MPQRQLPTKRSVESHQGMSEFEKFAAFKNDGSEKDSGDWNHRTELEDVTTENRRSVSGEVNPDYETPSANDVRRMDSDSDSSDSGKTDEELAQEYREKYGHHDSHDASNKTRLVWDT